MMLLLLAQAGAVTAPICTDRSAKANAVCTVPAGAMQLESAAIAWSHLKAGGTTSETLSIASSVAKVGLDDRSDLQLGFTPYVRIRSAGSTINGPGDVVLRYKRRLSDTDQPVQVALIPFVKLPTARRGIGNRKVEGGVALPISKALSKSLAVTFGPEVDLVADSDGRGHHVAIVNLFNLAAPVAPRLTLVAELWSSLNLDPAKTIRQASADLAAAYLVTEELQIDMGANVGLTRDTPDIELSLGVSLRI